MKVLLLLSSEQQGSGADVGWWSGMFLLSFLPDDIVFSCSEGRKGLFAVLSCSLLSLVGKAQDELLFYARLSGMRRNGNCIRRTRPSVTFRCKKLRV